MTSGPRIAVAASPRNSRQNLEASSKFQEAANSLRERFPDLLATPLQIGEATFSAVLTDATQGFDFATALAEAVWPMQLRVAMITVGHQVGAAADTQAHSRALALLGEAIRHRATFRFQVSGRKEMEIHLAEAAALLHSTLMAEWTQTRAEAVRAYRALGRQRDAAQKLGITQQAVSQMLRGARLKEMGALETAMREWFTEEARPGLWPLRNFEKEAS